MLVIIYFSSNYKYLKFCLESVLKNVFYNKLTEHLNIYFVIMKNMLPYKQFILSNTHISMY